MNKIDESLERVIHKYLKNKKAITLIALVITIVVLVILSSVAITLSLGNNGIFNKAKYAKQEYLNAKDYEETELAKVTNAIDGEVDGTRANPITYSEEEHSVGTWKDGKILYEKTFDFKDNLPRGTSDFRDLIDLSSYDINKIISIYTIFTNANDTICMNSSYIDAEYKKVVIYRTSTKKILFKQDQDDLTDLCITIQYTKNK